MLAYSHPRKMEWSKVLAPSLNYGKFLKFKQAAFILGAYFYLRTEQSI